MRGRLLKSKPDHSELEQDPERLRELHAQMMLLWGRVGMVIKRAFSNFDAIPDDEWEISYKPGDTINISEIRNRLKQRVDG